jgi:uncharacterized protein (DUF2267 family)/osmotically-inducible protein OsmY
MLKIAWMATAMPKVRSYGAKARAQGAKLRPQREKARSGGMAQAARKVALLIGAVAVVTGLRALYTRNRSQVRQLSRRAGRQMRYRRGRLQGRIYRLRRGRPDPDVDDSVLADRIRSSLGPLEAQFDIPHVHVMVEDHVALVHGDVATAEQAEEIERAVAEISGVDGVESYLHVGLLPSDTRPSEGRRVQPPSAALEQLLNAAIEAGVGPQYAPRAVRAVLTAFLQRIPDGERDQVTTHLPEDVRRLAAEPRLTGRPLRRTRTVAELTSQVIAADGMSPQQAEPVISAVLGALRRLVPEEEADVASVLPSELRELWRKAS